MPPSRAGGSDGVPGYSTHGHHVDGSDRTLVRHAPRTFVVCGDAEFAAECEREVGGGIHPHIWGKKSPAKTPARRAPPRPEYVHVPSAGI